MNRSAGLLLAVWLASGLIFLLSLFLLTTGSVDRQAYARETAKQALLEPVVRGDRRATSTALQALMSDSRASFLFLRLSNAQGQLRFSDGVLEPWSFSPLSDHLAARLKKGIYSALSTKHALQLQNNGRVVGQLDYGLAILGASGGAGLWPWLGFFGLLLSLPVWLWMTWRLYTSTRNYTATDGSGQKAGRQQPLSSQRDLRATQGKQSLENSTPTHSRVLDSLGLAILLTNRQMQITYVNQSALKLLHQKPTEATGKDLAEVLALMKQDKSRGVLGIKHIISGESEKYSEDFWMQKGGRLFPVNVAISPLRDQTHKVEGTLVLLTDQTDTVSQLNSELERGAIAQNVLDRLDGAILVTDTQDIVVAANAAAYRLLSARQGEITGTRLTQLLPDIYERYGALETMIGKHCQAGLGGPGRVQVSVKVESVMINGQQGHVLVIDKDSGETQAANLGKRVHGLLSRTSDEVLVLDAESLRITQVSAVAVRNLGYPIKKLQGMTPIQLYTDISAAEFQDYVEQLKSGQKQEISYQAMHKRANGSAYAVDVRLSYSQEERPPALLAICQPHSEGPGTETGQDDDRVFFMGYHDSLTRLPSRLFFMQGLHRRVQAADKQGDSLMVAYVGLQDFSRINRLFGYEAGDRMLQNLAERIRATLSDGELCARIGGDEFAMCLKVANKDIDSLPQDAVPEQARQRLVSLFEPSLSLGGHNVQAEARVGITLYPADDVAPEVLLRHASRAMRKASVGEQPVLFGRYLVDHDTTSQSEALMIERFRTDLAQGELGVSVLPMVAISGQNLVAGLAQLQWPAQEQLDVQTIADCARKVNLINELAVWQLTEVCRLQSRWINMGLSVVPLFIDFSSLYPHSKKDLRRLEAVPQSTGCRAKSIVAMMSAADMSEQNISDWYLALQTAGFSIAITDVMNVDALASVTELKPQWLILSPSVTTNIVHDEEAVKQIKTLVSAARKLDAALIATAVSSAEQRDVLAALGCAVMSGDLVARLEDEHQFKQRLT